MLKFSALSEFAETHRLRFAADKLDRQFIKRRPKPFPRIGGKPIVRLVPETGDKKMADHDDKRFFHARSLPDLSCFQIDCNPRVDDLELKTETIHRERVEAWVDWLTRQSQPIARVGVSRYLVAAERDAVKARDDISGSCDYSLYFSVNDQGGSRISWSCYRTRPIEPPRRREFIETCLRAAGLQQAIHLDDTPQGYVIRSDVYQLRASWQSDQYDESALSFNLTDAAQAKQWTEQVAAALGAQFVGGAVSLDCQVADYTEHRATWNALGSGWELFTAAAYPADFDPFTAPPPTGDEESVYPLLYWESGETMYQCDLAAAASGSRLQVITNTSSERKLREYVHAADTGLAFEIQKLDFE